MAATKTSALNALAETYNRGYMAQHERLKAKFYSSLSKWPDGGKTLGASKRWTIQKRGAHSSAAIAEGGDYPAYNNPAFMQASITPVEIAGTVAVTELLAVIGQGEGFLGEGGDIASMYVKQTIKEAINTLNRQSLGYFTGRMGVVASTTDTSTTVPLDWPEGAFMFRRGMPVDFYDTDTGGSKQGASQTVVEVVLQGPSPSIVIDAARTLTAGWGVYRQGEYGIAMQGLRQIVGDSSISSTLFGITRSADPEVNALVFSASAGLQAYSEQLVRKAIVGIAYEADVEPDEIWCNEGMPAAHADSLAGSRIFTQAPSEGVPGYEAGYVTSKLGYNYNGKVLRFMVDRDLPARCMWVITRSLFRKHVTKELDWTGDGIAPDGGSSSPVWMQQPATTTYSSNKMALVNAFCAIGHLQPKLNALIEDVADKLAAADDV